MNLKSVLSILAITLTLGLPACAGNADKDGAKAKGAIKQIEPVEQMYNRAARALDQNNYNVAADGFDEVEQQYPYSQWATRAQLMSAYAHYRDMKYDNAIMGLDRFIQLHPGNENIAYAYYLRALGFYEQISDVRRDQRMTQLALEGLRQVAERFPNTHYARDAQLKIDLTLDHLAGKEMEIGRYYLTRDQYQAAINRFQKVVDDYQTTTHIPEALHRLTEAYLALGIPSEAKKATAVLGHNYPDSRWYEDSYSLITGKKVQSAPDNRTVYEKTLGRIF
jgi:outer membrane protein assembly factor BamD